MSTASNSSSYTTDDADQIKKQTLRHGNYQVDVVGQAKCYNNPLQNVLITGSSKTFQTLRTSATGTTIVSLIRHWLVTGQLDPPSKFNYAKLHRNCVEDLKSLKDLYQDYWGKRERKTNGVLADSTTSHVG